jgi:hypothetical protein
VTIDLVHPVLGLGAGTRAAVDRSPNSICHVRHEQLIPLKGTTWECTALRSTSEVTAPKRASACSERHRRDETQDRVILIEVGGSAAASRPGPYSDQQMGTRHYRHPCPARVNQTNQDLGSVPDVDVCAHRTPVQFLVSFQHRASTCLAFRAFGRAILHGRADPGQQQPRPVTLVIAGA